MQELLPVVLDELQKATDSITEEEVVRVRNQIRAGLLMSLESPSSRAGQLARQQILWGRVIPLQETVDRINRITVERVKHVAHQLFSNARISLAGVGPAAAAQALPCHPIPPSAFVARALRCGAAASMPKPCCRPPT